MASPNTKKQAKDKIEENELYNTPVEAMVALSNLESLDGLVFYDPCDGIGGISDYLELKGAKVYRSDIKKYRECNNWLGERDFLSLTEKDIPEDVDFLIFNPPFTLTEAFIDKAYDLDLPLWMFNRLTVLESISRATKFVNKWNLDRVCVFGRRVSCTKGEAKEPTANSVCYAWYQFGTETGWRGSATIEWIL